MKAVAVFPNQKTVKLIEHEEPHITEATQVKLKMLEVGVCGTDKEICQFDFGIPPQGSEYLILGHEGLGEVIEIGTAVHTLKPGDLVVPTVRYPCTHSHCRPCRAGRQDFCTTFDYTECGIQAAHGFMAEYFVGEAQYMHFVPAALRSVAVLVEPLTIAEKAFAQIMQMQQRLPWLAPDARPDQPGAGLRAVVLGAGPIGQLGAMWLVSQGFETYVYSRSPQPNIKADLITAIGATYISSSSTSPEEFVQHIGNIDVVYEAMGGEPVTLEILKLLGPNGIFAFTGVPAHNSNLSLRNLVAKNHVVFGTVNAGPDAFTHAIRDLEIFLERWPQPLHALITGRYPIEQFAGPVLGNIGGIKNSITMTTL